MRGNRVRVYLNHGFISEMYSVYIGIKPRRETRVKSNGLLNEKSNGLNRYIN